MTARRGANLYEGVHPPSQLTGASKRKPSTAAQGCLPDKSPRPDGIGGRSGASANGEPSRSAGGTGRGICLRTAKDGKGRSGRNERGAVGQGELGEGSEMCMGARTSSRGGWEANEIIEREGSERGWVRMEGDARKGTTGAYIRTILGCG